MKKLLSLAIALAVVTSAGAASAGLPLLFSKSKSATQFKPGTPGYMVAHTGATFAPTPIAPAPAPGAGGTVAPAPVATGGCGPVFQCVKVEDRHNIHPCAVPKMICIVDPCWRPDPCSCCQTPTCVQVQICVPPCSPCDCRCGHNQYPKVKVSKDGRKVYYDYGKYGVKIESKKGRIIVNYDD